MSAIGTSIDFEYGICVGEKTIGHIVQANDLVLIYDLEKLIENQLNGFFKCCSLNLMSVNKIKLKCMFYW